MTIVPKRKKYPKLPNGYGSIKYLGKGRRNPYAVHPCTQEFALNGSPITPKALCYTDAWIKGFTILTAYRAGNYYAGMELELQMEDTTDLGSLAQKILADYSATRPIEKEKRGKSKTFAQVYEEFFKWKFTDNKGKEYAKDTIASTRSAFNRCPTLHDKLFTELRYDDLQKAIDDCPLSHASLEQMINLIRQMYKYAMMRELAEKNYSSFLKINILDEEEHGKPFSEDELKILWKNRNNPTIEFTLIMCYSGYRIKAYKTLEINIAEMYFKGGIKTASGKNRIVPIHSAISSLVESRILREKGLLTYTEQKYRNDLYTILKDIGIKKHTPHDCRHTFSMLCEKYGVNENDRRRMLGHSFGQDITNGTYGHRSLDDLRIEIEKIKVCY